MFFIFITITKWKLIEKQEYNKKVVETELIRLYSTGILSGFFFILIKHSIVVREEKFLHLFRLRSKVYLVFKVNM